MADVHKFSSTQFNLPSDLAAHVKKAARAIPDFALHGDGRETEPHVTVKYGLHNDNANDIRHVIGSHPTFKIKLGKTSHFPDSGHGDVIKADVYSDDLIKLHHKIERATPYTDTHPGYKGHVTVAYVKPGLGHIFSGSNALEGKEAKVDKIMFSSRNGSRETIPLLGASGPIGRYKRK